jgi:hypothetical protein
VLVDIEPGRADLHQRLDVLTERRHPRTSGTDAPRRARERASVGLGAGEQILGRRPIRASINRAASTNATSASPAGHDVAIADEARDADSAVAALTAVVAAVVIAAPFGSGH